MTTLKATVLQTKGSENPVRRLSSRLFLTFRDKEMAEGIIILKDITVDGLCRDILIEDGIIRRIAPAGEITAAGDAEVMDCRHKVAMPGFINMHTHTPMTLMRSIEEDVEFHEWIAKIWKVEAGIDHDFIYWSSKVAFIEMLKSGTTTFNDQYWSFQATMKAAAEMGIRPVTGYDIMDRMDEREAERQKQQCIDRYEEYKDEMAAADGVYAVNFHAIYSVSEPMMVWAAEFARKNGLLLHTHLSETRKEVEDCRAAHGGLTPVEYLDSLGILGDNLIAAHTLWLTEHDIELLAKNHVNCVHNINSNCKLTSGYRFLYNEMKSAGVNICLGTDGAASSNNLDMLETMKTTALFQKAWRSDPKALPLGELIDMATVNAAKALKLNTGRIAEGYKADICIVDTDSPYFISPGSFLANYVYGAHSDCIDSVICNGKFVMKGRQVPGEKEILHEARKVLREIKI